MVCANSTARSVKSATSRHTHSPKRARQWRRGHSSNRTSKWMCTGDVIFSGTLNDVASLMEAEIVSEYRARGVPEGWIPLVVADHTGRQPAIQVEIDAHGFGCIPIPANWKTGEAILVALPGELGVSKVVITPPTTEGKTPFAKAGETMRVLPQDFFKLVKT